MGSNAEASEFPQSRRKQLTEMCIYAYAWVGVLLMYMHISMCDCEKACI